MALRSSVMTGNGSTYDLCNGSANCVLSSSCHLRILAITKSECNALCRVAFLRRSDEDPRVTVLYSRPTGRAARLIVEPQLASWDRTGSPAQVRLDNFLCHVDDLAAPMLTVDGLLAVELTVGLPDDVPLTAGGRDLDNYLLPLAQRLGPARIAAMFGRKIHGSSSLTIAPAQLGQARAAAQFSGQLSGSYERKEWKAALRDLLLQAGHLKAPAGAGPASMDIAVTTGPGRNWANLWKPLIDSFGPVLGEDARRPFHPNDDRITELGLHHQVDAALGYDVMIRAWWKTV